jgi:nucleotide-binding universal stress UspA family protein
MTAREQQTSDGEIVCAITAGAGSKRAGRLAARLAERLSLRLALIHVQMPIAPPDAAIVEGPHPVAPIAVDLVAPLELLTPPPVAPAAWEEVLVCSQPTRRDIVPGVPSEALQRLSEAEDTALLVVADDGGGPLTSVFAGNAPRGAIRSVACPMVLVPELMVEHANVRNVLCGVDEDDAAADVASAAADLAGRLGGRLRFVHVVGRAVSGAEPEQTPLGELDESSRRATEALFDRCRTVLGAQSTAEFVTIEGDAADGLRAAAEDMDAGLIVIGRPLRGALGSALMGSAAHALLRAGGFPVVVVPPAGGAAGEDPA